MLSVPTPPPPLPPPCIPVPIAMYAGYGTAIHGSGKRWAPTGRGYAPLFIYSTGPRYVRFLGQVAVVGGVPPSSSASRRRTLRNDCSPVATAAFCPPAAIPGPPKARDAAGWSFCCC